MMMAPSLFPPCARDLCPKRLVRTVVVKIQASSNAINWASIQTGVGQTAQAAALVHLETDKETQIVYVVLTNARPDTLGNIESRLEKKLRSPPIEATVEWVRILDRHLTLLFGWGDVWVDSEHIDKAVGSNNASELRRCFPMLSNVIASGKIDLLPAVAAEGLYKSGLLCIADAPRDADPQEQTDRLYIQHELEGKHLFVEPGKNWQCSLCTRFPAARCMCGAQRCALHQLPPTPPNKVVWKQSDCNPAPFFVQNPVQMRSEHKVEWIREIVPDNASLVEFAIVYVDIFAENIGEERHRKNCLDLYRLFNPSFAAKKECELCPMDLHEFQSVFNPEALPRCRWCSKKLEGRQKEMYCDANCAAEANPPQVCCNCHSDKPQKVVQIIADAAMQCDNDHVQSSSANGLTQCQNCKYTELCDLVAVPHNKRGSASAPQHWSKRRRS